MSDINKSNSLESQEIKGAIVETQCSSSQNERQLIMRIDVKILSMVYLIDLAISLELLSISVAILMNISKELHLAGIQTFMPMAIFVVTYVLFKVPSDTVLKKFEPHVWLSGCELMAGCILLWQGLVQSYGGLLTSRFLLGLAETGICSGSYYLIGLWYKREEAQKRLALYSRFSLIAHMFWAPLISFAEMAGVGYYINWRWVSVLEGIVITIIGITSYFLLPSLPEKANWLTEDEKAWVIARMGSTHVPKIAPHRQIVYSDQVNILS